MRRIYKYELYTEGVPRTITGKIRRVLNVLVQGVQPVVWVELDDDCDIMEFTFISFRTGEELTERTMADANYLGTIQDIHGHM